MKRINMHIIAMLTAAATAISLTGCANDTSARDRDDDDDSPRHSRTVDADENTSSNSIADILGASNEVSSALDAETSVTESTTAASSAADPIVSEPETSVPDANVPGNTDSADIYDWPAGVATASPAAPSAPVPEADWAPILSNQEMFTAIGTNLENAESFVMTCHIEGGFPNPHQKTDDDLFPSEHNFTLVVTKNATYLKSTFQDLTTDTVPSVYEEYNIVENGMLTTITKNEGTWTSNSAAKTETTNAKDAAVDSVHLLQLFDINSVYADLDATARMGHQTNADLKEAPIERTDDGNIAITLPQWRKIGKLLDSDFKTTPFAGLIRFPGEKLTNEWTADLNKEDPGRAREGNAICIIDNEYRLKAIEADIGIGSLYDIHVSIEFSNWNNVLPIEVPEYTVVEAE